MNTCATSGQIIRHYPASQRPKLEGGLVQCPACRRALKPQQFGDVADKRFPRHNAGA